MIYCNIGKPAWIFLPYSFPFFAAKFYFKFHMAILDQNAYFNEHLECTVPKCWSKFTTYCGYLLKICSLLQTL